MSFISLASTAVQPDKLAIAVKYNGRRFSLSAVIIVSVNYQSSKYQLYGVNLGDLSAIQLNDLGNLLLKHGKAV